MSIENSILDAIFIIFIIKCIKENLSFIFRFLGILNFIRNTFCTVESSTYSLWYMSLMALPMKWRFTGKILIHSWLTVKLALLKVLPAFMYIYAF